MGVIMVVVSAGVITLGTGMSLYVAVFKVAPSLL